MKQPVRKNKSFEVTRETLSEFWKHSINPITGFRVHKSDYPAGAKEDRELSGLAKGFLVEFEDKGTFLVGLNGFDNEDKRELLLNKESYIGKHFKYTGMKPVKDFPRHAFFKGWRDGK